MHKRVLAVLAVIALTVAGCSGDDGDPDDAGTPTSAVTAPVPTVSLPPTPAPDDTPTSTTIEVQGVVGVVLLPSRIIEIRPTGPEQYSRIALTPNAVIMRPGGAIIDLADVRPSDRIVAYGRPGDDGDTLVSDDVTVQQVIQGGPPGGG